MVPILVPFPAGWIVRTLGMFVPSTKAVHAALAALDIPKVLTYITSGLFLPNVLIVNLLGEEFCVFLIRFQQRLQLLVMHYPELPHLQRPALPGLPAPLAIQSFERFRVAPRSLPARRCLPFAALPRRRTAPDETRPVGRIACGQALVVHLPKSACHQSGKTWFYLR